MLSGKTQVGPAAEAQANPKEKMDDLAAEVIVPIFFQP